jgi:hypothetical protein
MAIPIPNPRDTTAAKIREVNILPQHTYKYSKTFDPIYVYNIGRWAGEGRSTWVRNSGTGHTFVIGLAASPEFRHTENYAKQLRELDESLSDEEIKEIVAGVRAGRHSMPTLVPDPVIEFYPTRLGSPPKSETWEGMRVAQEIVNLIPGDDGVGAGKEPASDLRYWGVFIAKGKVPTKAEMDEVREWYFKRLDSLIKQGNELFRNNEFKVLNQTKVYRWAAGERGIDVAWNKTMQEMAGPKKTLCPVCINPIIEGAKKCQHCGEWLDGRDVTAEGKAKK